MMRWSLAILLLSVAVMGCETPKTEEIQVRTVDDTRTELREIESPERLVFDVSRKDEDSSEEGAIQRMEEDAQTGQFTENLPFAPLIAMDPITGEKLSIIRETPTAEYNDRIYYFSSEAHKQTFLADPEEYTKGRFSRY